MTRFAPLFLALLTLTAACFSQSGTLELGSTTPETSTPTPTIEDVTYSVNFEDVTTWTMATITCWDNYQPKVFFSEFDSSGWAEFDANCEGDVYFNVARGDMETGLELNVNSNVLALIAIDEASDVVEHQGLPDLEALLHLWVFTGEYVWGVSEMYDPLTQNDPDGSFWGCDEPQWFSPYGMPYGRPPPDAEDRCETMP